MAEFDVAVIGSSPFSGLLAGILARDHGRRVVRVGRRPSSQRLPRQLDFALPLTTRPETWQMVRRGEAETRRLLASLGVPAGITEIEVGITAEAPHSAAALDHMAHLALGYGHQVRRVPGGWSFRRVALLDQTAFEAKIGEWLSSAGVTSFDEGAPEAGITVLADDAAIFDHLPEELRPPSLSAQAMTATLVVSRATPIPIQRFVDHGVTLVARPGNAMLALVSGESEPEARLASILPGPFPAKRLATTRFRRIVSTDGAPVIGRPEPTQSFIVAGLGDAAAFFAPAVARLIAGTSDADENRWFAAHDPAQPREAIADFVVGAEAAP